MCQEPKLIIRGGAKITKGDFKNRALFIMNPRVSIEEYFLSNLREQSFCDLWKILLKSRMTGYLSKKDAEFGGKIEVEENY